MSNQWGYMNPETYVKKKTETKSLGLLETKSSESESDNESNGDRTNMMTEMEKFLDGVEKDDQVKNQRKEEKKRRKEEAKVAKIEPSKFLEFCWFFY